MLRRVTTTLDLDLLRTLLDLPAAVYIEAVEVGGPSVHGRPRRLSVTLATDDPTALPAGVPCECTNIQACPECRGSAVRPVRVALMFERHVVPRSPYYLQSIRDLDRGRSLGVPWHGPDRRAEVSGSGYPRRDHEQGPSDALAAEDEPEPPAVGPGHYDDG